MFEGWFFMKRRIHMFHNGAISVVQEYNHGLIQQYEELSSNYDQLKLSVEALYEKGVQSRDYSEKLTNYVDTIVIDKSNNREYIEYELDKKNIVSSQVKDHYNYNIEKLEKVLLVRNNMLKKRLEALDLDNIGTALNMLRDLYHKVSIDFERNRISKLKNDEFPMRGISFDFDEFDFDSFEKSEPFKVDVSLKGPKNV